MGFVVDAWPADVHRRRVFDDALFFCVAVEPDDGAQAAGDGGAGLAAIFEIAGVALDVDAADVEEAMVVLRAPGGELAQVQGVGVAGEAAVAGQEPEQRHPLDVGQHRLVPRDSGDGNEHGLDSPCSHGRRPRPQQQAPQPVEVTEATSSPSSLTRATRCRSERPRSGCRP